MRAAFDGYLGKEMQGKAKEWADETPNPKSLPVHKGNKAVAGLKNAMPKSKEE